MGVTNGTIQSDMRVKQQAIKASQCAACAHLLGAHAEDAVQRLVGLHRAQRNARACPEAPLALDKAAADAQAQHPRRRFIRLARLQGQHAEQRASTCSCCRRERLTSCLPLRTSS
jgi:hypothetical protein